MLIAVIILALALLVETGWFFSGMFGDKLDPTRTELIEEYWLEFIDWVQDARTIRSIQPPYELWLDSKTSDGTPKNVALLNEHNFWLWFQEYKWNKKAATERNKVRKEKPNNKI